MSDVGKEIEVTSAEKSSYESIRGQGIDQEDAIVAR